MRILSIYDQGTGWAKKNTSQVEIQSEITNINDHHPTWPSRMWQLFKIIRTEVKYPIK